VDTSKVEARVRFPPPAQTASICDPCTGCSLRPTALSSR
jgi:hypothetical protein